jgi:hypothetical protein
MSRRPALVTQADVARACRAARRLGRNGASKSKPRPGLSACAKPRLTDHRQRTNVTPSLSSLAGSRRRHKVTDAAKTSAVPSS